MPWWVECGDTKIPTIGNLDGRERNCDVLLVTAGDAVPPTGFEPVLPP